MIFPRLPFDSESLEPYISGNTIELHYKRFYQAYLNQLEIIKTNTVFENSDLADIIRFGQGMMQYNAIQVWNHEFYFSSLNHGPSYLTPGTLLTAINGCFGSFRYFKDAFIKYALISNRHGWIWLALNTDGTLEILKENKFNHPLIKGMLPLLTCDLWEHAYFSDYHQNMRAYIEAFLKVVNWEEIENRYNTAVSRMTSNQLFIRQI